ncbi:MAG TPA: patatin-like phospholipase family protein [Micromonosporaceae bacterium]|nr:patatin-like phospholipase family protein [Micromonosporaceae bacterium]
MTDRPIAFVLGGGGVLGAVEVGMLRALLRSGVRPDLIVGTSVGAINGVVIATEPSVAATDRLVQLWSSAEARAVYGDSLPRRVARFARTGTHLHSPEPLRSALGRVLGPVRTFADLAVPFQCCAASIERAAEHWFTAGPVVDAVVASASVPGLLPPARVAGEHFVDGGIVNSIPISRAVTLGARTAFVLQVGRIDRPLAAPQRPWEVARVAFEIARRHRFAYDLAALPAGIAVHVLPTGGGSARDDSPLAYRDMAAAARRMSRAYAATIGYLRENGLG